MTPLIIRPSQRPPEERLPQAHGISVTKRLLDILLAGFGLLVTLPLWALIALAIKLDSPGPVFYRQERVGQDRRRRDRRRERGGAPAPRRAEGAETGPERRRNDRRLEPGAGQLFHIVKFRSMRTDAEAAGPVWASRNDPRITRMGGFLRKSRLDELPQLWNILVGEMSLVGPRPERPYFVKRLMDRFPGYKGRLQVPPGLTGLAQIERAYDEDEDDVRRKLAYDLFYIDHRHILVDLKILVRTVGVVLGRKGAR
ncbi:MAG: sugar transferase [Candidatus Eisenbacteria bacterium]|nr:sugar transferase [Candidatus Eisenbacteria bacterium]